MFHEVNAFSKSETLVIDEHAPGRAKAGRNVRAIEVRAYPLLSKHVDLPAIQANLDALVDPEQVRLFAVDYDSRLPKLPDLTRFRRLEHLHLGCRQVRDYATLQPLRALKRVFMVAYKEADLGKLASLELDYLRLIRASSARLEMRASWAFLQSCSKLEDLGKSSIRLLILETCHRFSCASLSQVKGLKHLQLLGCRSVSELSWVRECKALERLVITATPVSRMDLASLRGARLRLLFLAIPNAKLIEVSRLLPNAAISNGDLWYRGGEIGEGADPVMASL